MTSCLFAEWKSSGLAKPGVVLQDDDRVGSPTNSSSKEGWRRLHTVQYYGLPNHAIIAVLPKQRSSNYGYASKCIITSMSTYLRLQYDPVFRRLDPYLHVDQLLNISHIEFVVSEWVESKWQRRINSAQRSHVRLGSTIEWHGQWRSSDTAGQPRPAELTSLE